MLRLRGALGPIAGVWLIYQMAAMALVPAAVMAGSVDERQVECSCPHRSTGGACPMHKTAPGSTLCLVRSADSSGQAVLSSLLGPVGVVPALVALISPLPIGTFILVARRTVSDRPLPPDPPPPRA
jgi:hypothetical protein